ncbi:MAG TPA: pilin [Patescibacteria group bacterium]|nr:pilin [Patescibacteria group bacterium]
MTHFLSAASAFLQTHLFFPIAHAQADAITSAGDALTDVGAGLGTDSSQTDLPTLIGSLINVIISVLGIVLVIYFLLGGFKYMQSQGDQKKIDDAKKLMTNAVIGIVIIVAAYAIATYVLTLLTSVVEPS